jgi:hypothetical protein
MVGRELFLVSYTAVSYESILTSSSQLEQANTKAQGEKSTVRLWGFHLVERLTKINNLLAR